MKMQCKCYFETMVNGKHRCVFRRRIVRGQFCKYYLAHDDRLTELLPHMQFVADRVLGTSSLTIGILALFLSVAGIIIALLGRGS